MRASSSHLSQRLTPARAALALLACVLSLASLPGCVTESKPRGPHRPQPADVRATSIFPSIRFFEDTDGDGYYDTSEVTIYLFAESYPEASVRVPGQFVFHLKGPGGIELRTWRFDQAACEKAVRPAPPGPGFFFRISLLNDAKGDKLDVESADLTCEFIPDTGDPVRSVATPVRIGRVGRI